MPNKRVVRLIKILAGTHSGSGDELVLLEGKLERFTHFWVLVIKSFIRNRCLVRAAALSYSSLLALIPLLAVVIGVTSSLLKEQGEDRIYSGINKFIFSMMPPASLSANHTNGSGVALNLTPISVRLAPTNAITMGGSPTLGTNHLAETNFTTGSIDLSSGTNPQSGEAPVSVQRAKDSGKMDP